MDGKELKNEESAEETSNSDKDASEKVDSSDAVDSAAAISDTDEIEASQEVSQKSKKRPKKPKSKKQKIKKIIIIVLCVLLAIILALVSTFFILTYIGKNQFHQNDTNITHANVEIEDDDTIIYKDKKYVLNKDVISILVIGIDRDDLNENLGAGNNGQADVIFVATIDTKTNEANIIPISRETLVDVNTYSANGQYIGTKKEQICLAYAYGGTAKECSENVMTSVRRLLFGINVSNYVAIELDGVAELTNMVGGVKLTCNEDVIIEEQLLFKKGENVILKGRKALRYITARDDDLESNDRRMARQKQFLSALMNETGNAVMDDFTMLGKFYSDLSPYFSSNISIPQLTYLAKECLTINFGDSLNYKSIEGDLSMGEKWVEFTADEEALLDLIIDVFYQPK